MVHQSPSKAFTTPGFDLEKSKLHFCWSGAPN